MDVTATASLATALQTLQVSQLANLQAIQSANQQESEIAQTVLQAQAVPLSGLGSLVDLTV